MSEKLGGLGRGYDRVWNDGVDERVEREWARANGQDDWADEMEAEERDDDWRRRVLHEGLR